jgi:hypothetical protein
MIGCANLFPMPDSKDRKCDKDQLWTMTMSEFQLELTLRIAHNSALDITRLATGFWTM